MLVAPRAEVAMTLDALQRSVVAQRFEAECYFSTHLLRRYLRSSTLFNGVVLLDAPRPGKEKSPTLKSEVWS